ncbi:MULTISPECIES: hypothetical protein [unclassified Chryseobacterium]|uniref:hypothetical protein n=1 Tax=unclassified Chryseobacterium TaxID=2593645 RepID=UPI002853131B|nr:hypothetical protein [Chryseobacterium sp. CFS7]MDR4892229.1 hypothetical protein [Chryseobacterium sp. CFS7]
MEFGDKLFEKIQSQLFKILDLAEKMHVIEEALNCYFDKIFMSPDKTIISNYPIGYTENYGVWRSRNERNINSYLNFINEDCRVGIPIDGIANLTTIMEVMFSDVILEIVKEYPKKIGDKVKIETPKIFQVETLEELHHYAAKKLINDISYKSPRDFIEQFKNISGVDLKECKQYQNYIELKSTRDIYVHGVGIANEIYTGKVGEELQRAKEGESLPCDFKYLYKSFEVCINILEFLENECHKKWKSEKYLRMVDGLDSKIS